MNRRQWTATALTATAMAISGCGDSPKSSHRAPSSVGRSAVPVQPPSDQEKTLPRTGPLGRSELIAQADIICGRVNHKRASFRIIKREDLVTVLPVLAAYEHAAVAQMQRLLPPASMTHSWNRLVAAANAVADFTTAIGEYARAGKFYDPKALVLVQKQLKARNEMLATAKRAGFKDCGQRHA